MPAQVAKTSSRGRADKGDQLQRRPLTAPYIPVITINIDGAPVARQIAYVHRAFLLTPPAMSAGSIFDQLPFYACVSVCVNAAMLNVTEARWKLLKETLGNFPSVFWISIGAIDFRAIVVCDRD